MYISISIYIYIGQPLTLALKKELRNLARDRVEVSDELRVRKHKALVDVVREVVHRALRRLATGSGFRVNPNEQRTASRTANRPQR